LYFQLFTHRDSFNGPSPSPNHGADASCQTNSAPTAALDTPYSNAGSNPDYDASDLGAGEHVAVREEDEDESHEGGNDGHAHGPALSMVGAVAALALITVIVAVCSEYLTGAIEQVSKVTGVNESFLGLIVLPIAGG
jgi:Ca2+/H+ antiporter